MKDVKQELFIGLLLILALMPAGQGIENYAYNNNSMDAIGSISSDWTGIIVTITAIALTLFMGVSLVLNEWFLKKLINIKKWLMKTFGLFFYGCTGSGMIALLYGMTKLLSSHASSGNPYLFKYAGYVIGFYTAMTLFGIPVKWFINRIRTNWKKAKGKRSEKPCQTKTTKP